MQCTTLEFSWNNNRLHLYYVDGWHSCLSILIFNHFLIPQKKRAILISQGLIFTSDYLHRGLCRESSHRDLVIASMTSFQTGFPTNAWVWPSSFHFSREDECDCRDPGRDWERSHDFTTWAWPVLFAYVLSIGAKPLRTLQGCLQAHFLHPYLNAYDQKLCNYLSPGIVFNHPEFTRIH